jgi:hypothetical protein
MPCMVILGARFVMCFCMDLSVDILSTSEEFFVLVIRICRVIWLLGYVMDVMIFIRGLELGIFPLSLGSLELTL